MWSLRLVQTIAGAAPLLLAGLGCAIGIPSLGNEHGMLVTVRDAETNQPIPSAQVHVWHFNQSSSADSIPSVTTDQNGSAQLQSVLGKSDDMVLEVAANGYATEEKSIDPQGRVRVQLYAEPRPTIELNVPRLYRGLVSVKVQILDKTPATPGQRLFPFEVPESGVVEVVGPELFRHLSPEFRAKLSDGTVLPARPEGLGVGFWWLKTSGEYEIFLVGTNADYEAFWRDHPHEQPKERKGGKGHGGGKGGQGEHGRKFGDVPSGESMGPGR